MKPQPQFKGDLNKYASEICKWMDEQPEKDTHTMTVHVDFDMFRRPGAGASLAAVAGRVVATDRISKKFIFRAVMQRKIDGLEYSNKQKQKRIDELEKKFSKELAEEEEKYWDSYGQDL